jgi:hypothetical protein
MLKKFIYLFLPTVFFAAVLSPRRAFAQTYPESIAFETSMEAVGQVLSSPALPSLDNDGRFSITPVLGIMKIEGVDYSSTNQTTGVSSNNEVRGNANGKVAGMTFNFTGSGDLGYFAIAAWSKVEGEISTKYSGSSITNEVRNISAESYIAAAGITYRLMGDAKSTFAMGLFGGPALIRSKTSADIYHTAGITNTRVDPNISAAYLGIQFTIRLGEFRINPYANVLGSLDVQCLKPQYSGSPYVTSTYNTCDDGTQGVSTLAMIAGAGINVGYGRFQFGLITKGGSPSPGLKTTPLMLSLRISL